MTGNAYSICLVSPGHLGSNPRLVKEADALAEAGYKVHVISGDSHAPTRVRDAAIIKEARWSSEIVPLRPNRGRYWVRRSLQIMFRRFFSSGFRGTTVALRAHHALGAALVQITKARRADLYIGHCLAALPAVVAAGQRFQTRIGFDLEDFHSGEAGSHGEGQLDNQIAHVLEDGLIRKCQHLTASAPLIAQRYQELYGVDPLVLLNVFPLKESVASSPLSETPSFYWFSQTIGPGRGLEEIIDILGRLGRKVRLDLRGHITEGYRQNLTRKAVESGIELQLLEPDVPGAMVRVARGYTAGLGLELSHPVNRDICLTNKAFTYLLAGVPVILSSTAAQIRLARDLGHAAVLIDLRDLPGSASRLEKWLQDEEGIRDAHREAYSLGRRRYNWDYEKSAFLERISKVLGSCEVQKHDRVQP